MATEDNNSGLRTGESKRRKCTYAARREKTKELRQEIRRLESQVAVLKIRSAKPGQESEVDAMLKQTAEENTMMRDSAKKHQLQVAKMQSAINQCLRTQQSHPLYTYISLPQHWDERKTKLTAIREEKLRNAYNFVMDPGYIVDVDKTTYSDELFE
ncbi:hypothetical protein PF008_g1023 [Phytophthora fragariae]|uniref:Uncharacterized protein n=1 Tax=Phytophthora fragariae TaxID=53985 RepID=A0A6G0SLV2_9STRA|nr:hypothetical protein PF008_g1023 [Phytophthora fragariae]